MSQTREIRYYKKDFWSREGSKFVEPHFRLRKCAKTVNKIAGGSECSLLDVGCGPATLARLLRPNIHYYGIDLAIRNPGPNLLEADILETPIKFENKHFDIVVAQGLFEYLGDRQEEKFREIAELLNRGGRFLVSYVNFDHRRPNIYTPYSNIQPFDDFRVSLTRFFEIDRCFPASHNWNHGQPNRKLVQMPNLYWNATIPFVSRKLAVEYFLICSPRP